MKKVIGYKEDSEARKEKRYWKSKTNVGPIQ